MCLQGTLRHLLVSWSLVELLQANSLPTGSPGLASPPHLSTEHSHPFITSIHHPPYLCHHQATSSLDHTVPSLGKRARQPPALGLQENVPGRGAG